MKAIFFRFTIITAAFQAVVGLIAAKWPDLFSTFLLGEDSHYGQFLYGYALVDSITVITALLLFFQLVALARFLNLRIMAGLFLATYLCARRRVIQGGLLAFSILISAFLIGFSMQGFLEYGFALAREVKLHDNMNRQWRIEAANEKEKQAGYTKALDVYKSIIKAFPGDSYNEFIEKKVARTEEIFRLSNLLVVKADSFAHEGDIMLAVDFYRSALAVFEDNDDAAAKLEELEKAFTRTKPGAISFFNYCRSGDFQGILDNIDSFGFYIRDRRAALRLKSENEQSRQRAFLQICRVAFIAGSPDAFFDVARRNNFASNKREKWESYE
jgi:tetratricopeptide (TPR) repeat protein